MRLKCDIKWRLDIDVFPALGRRPIAEVELPQASASECLSIYLTDGQCAAPVWGLLGENRRFLNRLIFRRFF